MKIIRCKYSKDIDVYLKPKEKVENALVEAGKKLLLYSLKERKTSLKCLSLIRLSF